MTAISCKPVLAARSLRLALALLVLLCAGWWRSSTALAQDPQPGVEVYAIQQQDLDGDGLPDLTVIDCSFVTSADRVLVYDRGHDMAWADDWQDATDFVNDLWIFDAASDDRADLILSFGSTEEGLVAEIWDDQNSDGAVGYRDRFPQLQILESAWPTVRVIAPDGWWQRQGQTNFNLHLAVDGPVRALHQAHHIKQFTTDGVADVLMQVRDWDDDGKPDLHWIDVWPEGSSNWGYYRTLLMVNPNDTEVPISRSIFWPYLGSALKVEGPREDRPAAFAVDAAVAQIDEYGFYKYYGKSYPPIQISWQHASVAYVGEFVASRAQDDNWFIYSINRAQPGHLSNVDFEAPFVFYDLAADDDGYPELQIRLEKYLADPLIRYAYNQIPRQIIRYSWDQDNNQSWDFKLGLVGRHTITDTFTVDDFTLRTVAPAQLPDWTLDRSWDGATFVAAEDPYRWTSEGIYEWGPTEPWFQEYLTGIATDPPSEDYRTIPPGLRGEVAFHLFSRPQLYLSAVDKKLHLLGATHGVWQIDDRTALHYENLDGQYINRWEVLKDGTPTESLTFLPGYMIYAGSHTVQILPASTPAAIFTVQPPRNHEEWKALGRQLEEHPAVDPTRLQAMMRQFGQPAATITGAVVEDLRQAGGEFQFVLKLSPGFQVQGDDLLSIAGLAPGDYVVSHTDDFVVRPVPPPQVAVRVGQSQVQDRVFVGEQTLLNVKLINLGYLDRRVVLIGSSNHRATSEIFLREEIDLPAQGEIHRFVGWTPTDAGESVLSFHLESADGAGLTPEMTSPISIQAVSRRLPIALLNLSTRHLWRGFSLLLFLALLSGLSAYVSVRAKDQAV